MPTEADVVHCLVCSALAHVQTVTSVSNEAFVVGSLRPTWIVADISPLGDEGLGVFCSEVCLLNYFEPEK
jgi:hypothetical protein